MCVVTVLRTLIRNYSFQHLMTVKAEAAVIPVDSARQILPAQTRHNEVGPLGEDLLETDTIHTQIARVMMMTMTTEIQS